MSYLKLDSVLNEWATKYGLNVHTRYQDVEVRSIDIISPKGERFQLWVDEPNLAGDIEIHIWDMKKKRKDFSTLDIPFKGALEAAYQQANKWF